MNEFNGVDLSNLDPVVEHGLIPAVVPGRCASIDADALCYMVAAVCEDDAFAICKEQFHQAAQHRMQLCAADSARLHLTGANKGNRFDIAMVKEYQANRQGKDKPRHLEALREHMQSKYTSGQIVCIMNEDQEADDGMAQDNYSAGMRGDGHLSIIHSIDKDLKMCSGLHCDWNTFEIVDVDGFGECYLDDSGSTKKVKGYGTSFFWHQMLMGDTADNIPGLPAIKGRHALKLASKAVLDAVAALDTGANQKTGKPLTAVQMDKAQAKVDAFAEKGKPCGTVAAYKILADCTNDLDAMTRVISLYRSYYGSLPFTMERWDGTEHELTAGHMVLEQAQLLWMRRVVGEHPSDFFLQVVNGGTWYE